MLKSPAPRVYSPNRRNISMEHDSPLFAAHSQGADRAIIRDVQARGQIHQLLVRSMANRGLAPLIQNRVAVLLRYRAPPSDIQITLDHLSPLLRHRKVLNKGGVDMLTILIIILVLLLIGALPTWPYSSRWGYYPSGGLGLVLVILIVLLLIGRV